MGYDSGRNFKEYSSVNTYGSDKWNFYPLDTRADGKLGFLVVSAPFSWNGYQLYMPNADFSNLLKSTTDSHGNITTVTYKKMADTSIRKQYRVVVHLLLQDTIAYLLLLLLN